MTALTIKNLRLTPYQQKDAIKAVWGDTLTLTFMIPHVAGESYVCGIDNERVVYPPSRPVCAYTNVFTRDGENVTFSLPLNTSKFRSYVSSIRKPMPVWLQVCRVGLDGKCETLVLDDILALPSVLDATNTVCPGDPLKQLLENKMDKPAAAGAEGQVLTMDADGHYAWADLPHIPEDPVQSDWDESDSSNLAYIKNKPAISKVGHTGEYNDILNKPDLKPVATSGSYEDLTDKPHIPVDPVQADYGQSDSTALDYIKHKPDLSVYSLITETGNSISMSIDENYDLVVTLLDKAGNTLSTQDVDLPIESMIVDATYANGVLTLTLQNGNTVDVDISDIVSGLVPDSRKVNGHALDEDVTISYNDLTDKPVIPAAQIQSDWDESDSQAVDFIKGKPTIPAAQVQSDWDQSDSSSPAYIQNKPEISAGVDSTDYLCFTAAQANSTVQFNRIGSFLNKPNTFETSTDKINWTEYTFEGYYGPTITLAKIGDKIWWRGSTAYLSNSGNYYNFIMTGKIYASGDVMSLLGTNLPLYQSDSRLRNLFDNCTSLLSAPKLPCMTLVVGMYHEMFKGCTSLTEAPELPATVLNEECYNAMFKNCTSLQVAPLLHATSLSRACYRYMFEGCTSLKSIRTAQTDWNSNQYCYNWLNNASSTGVFECPSALDMTTRDASHVPAGWIVKYTDDPQADWDESDSLVSTYIKNKPVIPEPTEQVQADWDESDSTAVDYIKNKPAISGGSDDADYLCFELARDPENKGVKLRLDKNGSPSEISLEYSMDRQTWTTYTWSGTTGYEITLSGAGSKAWFRSESTNSSFSSGSYNYYKFIGENVAIGFGVGRFYVSGNIMSLVDKTCQSTVIPNNYCFTSLFSGNISILTAPKLPATTLKDSCYFNLFANQSRLVKAPELPATTIAQGCYGRMFFNCTSLTEVPELPATTLAQGCYNEMFSGCSDLTETPDEMPVTTLADTCYASMFRNCTSLKKAPKLPATTLTSSCYNGMFYGCSSLTEAPDLPATAMSNSCYNGMFYGCTSLYYVKLAATSTATSATQYMFSNITTNGMLEAPDALDVTGFMPATWVKVPASSSPDGSTTSVAEASSASIYGITPGQSETGVLTVASSLTLNAIGTTSMDIAYAEVVIDLAVGATVTAGTGLTLVDTPTDGKRNVCVVRWQGGTARLYVVDVMDIPA